MTFWGFISSCGGSLGLFLGFSFMSVFADFCVWLEKFSLKKSESSSVADQESTKG